MVITRSQSSQNRQVETENMDRSSDNESEASFPELLSRDQMVDLDSDDVLTRRQNGNSYNIDQRFNEINRQIGDLTNIVLTLTNQFASVNGEGNRLNPATTSTDSRSDNYCSIKYILARVDTPVDLNLIMRKSVFHLNSLAPVISRPGGLCLADTNFYICSKTWKLSTRLFWFKCLSLITF